MGKVAKAIGKVVAAPLKIAAEVVNAPFKIVGTTIGGKVGNIISQIGSLGKNTLKYAASAVEKIVSGTLNLSVGDFKQAKEDYKDGLKKR